MATEAANETNEWLCRGEVVTKLPACVVDFRKCGVVARSVRLPLVDVLHLGTAGTPEAHPNHHSSSEAVFGNAVE